MRAKLSLTALAASFLLMLAGALAYPGGSWLHPHSVGFSVTENFWCDLMRDPAHNGARSHLSPWLGSLAFSALGVALAPFWLEVARCLPPRSARFVRLAGVSSAVGTALVALLPSDRFPTLHPPIVLVAGISGFCCGLVYTQFVLAARRPFRLFAAASLWLLVTASLNLGLYLRAIYFRASETLWLPVSQKLATVGLVAWMLTGLAASARLPKR